MKKRILSFALAMVMVLATIPAVAIGSNAVGKDMSDDAVFTTGEGKTTTFYPMVDIDWYNPVVPNKWDWTLSEEGVLTVTGTGVVAPTDGAYPWDEQLDSIKKVVVTGGITEIGAQAFDHCENLVEVVLGEGVAQVGGDAFAYNGALTTFTFPSTLQKFGQGTVWGTGNISKIILSGGLTATQFQKIVASSSIYNDNYLNSKVDFYYPGEAGWDYTLVDGVLTITGNGPMSGSALEDYGWNDKRSEITKVVVGDQITKVTARAFQGCSNLDEIVFGKSVVVLEQDAFSGCGFVSKATFGGAIRSIGQGIVFNTTVGTVELDGMTKERFLDLADDRSYNTNLANDSVNYVLKNVSIVIVPYNSGWENWSDNTQMILNIKDIGGTEIGGLRENKNLTWKLTYSVPGGFSKQITLAPSSGWGTWCRFTPCCGEGENQFIPSVYNGTVNYTVKLDIYEGDVLKYTSDPTSGFKIGSGVTPIVNTYEQGSRLVHNDKCYVQAAFAEPREIETITVVNYADATRYYTWDVYGSNDLESWTYLGGKVNNEPSDADGYTLAMKVNADGTYDSYQYLRVYGTLNSANGGYHFTDIQITAPEENMSLVTWVVDGVSEYYRVKNGEIPVYPAGTPVKESSYTKDYVFSGWDKEVVAVDGNVTYTAQFEEKVRAPREMVIDGYYGATIENWDGDTQLLAILKNDGSYDLTETWNKRGSFKYELTFEWIENDENVSKTIECTPDSCAWRNANNTFLRFEICKDEANGFVPVIGTEYTFTLNIYDMEADGYHYLTGTSEETYKFKDADDQGNTFVPIHDHVCPEGDEIEVPATTVAPGSNTYICEKCHGEITEELAQFDKVAGDMDADGKVSISDVTKLLSVIAGTDTLHEELNGDLDGDDVISISDVTKLLVMISEQEKQ